MAGENKSSSMNEYTWSFVMQSLKTVSIPLSTREHVFDMNKGGNARIRPFKWTLFYIIGGNYDIL